jgi:hypothetical protein
MRATQVAISKNFGVFYALMHSAFERRENDREQGAPAIALVNQLALMPAYDVFLNEPNWEQVWHSKT